MHSENSRVVRIGCASGFWGDSSLGAPQLVQSGQIDYLVFDYLAELTMSILAGARRRDSSAGYATDFVTVAMHSVLKEVVARGIRVVSNAGGMNPQGCAQALRAVAEALAVDIKIAVVLGDDVMPLLPQLRMACVPVVEMQSGAPLPEHILSANAYLGASAIKTALAAGADVVITGRCVDSAVTLGVLMHEFGWQEDEYDKLAGGSLAGHIIECGCQGSGGLHTDWRDVPDWPGIGYPIVQCRPDGSFTATKPTGTGGLVNCAVIAEQMLYEIADPGCYLLPDVICDFTQVTLVQEGEHRVSVRGARGYAPTDTYKVCATYVDGFKVSSQLVITGLEAAAKAQRSGEAIFARVSQMLADRGWAPFSATLIEVVGGVPGGADAIQLSSVVLRVSATHAEKAALQLLAHEVAPAGTSWAPGTTGGSGGRADATPSILQFAFLLNKAQLHPTVHLEQSCLEVAVPVAMPRERTPDPGPLSLALMHPQPDWVEVPLIALAWGRSGDKADTSNIGIIARQATYLPILRAQLTPQRLGEWLADVVRGKITRYEVPGIHAFNFVCEQALGGGGMASLRYDPLGKGMGQRVLAMPVRIPPQMLSCLKGRSGVCHCPGMDVQS